MNTALPRPAAPPEVRALAAVLLAEFLRSHATPRPGVNADPRPPRPKEVNR
jgi:hypothetical protein